jgi:hypothetical protein
MCETIRVRFISVPGFAGTAHTLTKILVIPAKPGTDMKRMWSDPHPEPKKVADFRDFRSAAVPMLHLRAPGFAGITNSLGCLYEFNKISWLFSGICDWLATCISGNRPEALSRGWLY